MSEATEGRVDGSHREVRMKIWHPGCWTLETTAAHPGTHIIENALYPSEERIVADLVLIADTTDDLETFMAAIEDHPVVEGLTVLGRSAERSRVLVDYDADSSIVPEVADADFVPIEPIHITDGYEHWTVMTREERFGQLITRLQQDFEVEIESIDGFSPGNNVEFLNPLDLIEISLSDRQQESLLAAFEAGYYEWPRDVSAGTVAETLGISNTTFLEHLRVGEQKIMQVVLAGLAENPRF